MIVEIFKQEKAITLPALIIQIILILIIASIGLTTLTSSGGILETATSTASAYKLEEVREKIKLKLLNLNMEKIPETGKATLEDVLNLKNTDNEIADAYESNENVVLIIDNYECVINKNFEIESVNKYNPSQLWTVRRPITAHSSDE